MFGLLLLLPLAGVNLAELLGLSVAGSLALTALPVLFAPLAALFMLGSMPLVVPAPLLLLATPVLAAPTLLGASALHGLGSAL
jgi:hypothetical protein